ncbi:MAG: type II toxin-antitoxin system HicB family antitoxin [Chloroflexota bacterium]
MDGFTVVLSPDPNVGGYSVSVPAMPGAITEGDTREEALAAAAEVMAAWLELAREHGDGPLAETPALVAAEVAFVLGYREEEGWDRSIETTVVRPAVLAG